MIRNNKKILVKGKNRTEKEPLNYYPNGSFNIQWEKNNTWQLTFTMINDKSVAYSLLGVEASIYFDNQEYIVKQCTPDYSNGIGTKQITATHVYNEVQRVMQRTTKTGTLTYSVADVLKFVLNGNKLGFTYQVIGSFDKEQITDLGNMTGKDMLSKITDTWSNAVIYPDNKKIRVYSQDKFAKNNGNRLDYRANSNVVNLAYDSTNITNQVMAIGAQKEGSSDDKPEYYFQPFLVEDSKSVKEWGLHPTASISDDRFHDKASMKAYALSQLQPEPALTISVTEDTQEKPVPGDVRRLEVREDGFVTNVEVVGYTWYPLDYTNTSITLNNNAQTVLNFKNNYQKQLNLAIRNQNASAKAKYARIQKNVSSLDEQNKSFKDAYSKMQNTISDLEYQIKKLQESSNNGDEKPDNWTPGTKFMDISDYQRGFTQSTFNNLHTQGIKGVIIKLSQGSEDGTAYVNSYFSSQKDKATKAKMKFIGTYHYLTSTSVADATNEGKWYLKQLQKYNVPKNTIVSCDLEDGVLSSNKTTLTNELKAFYKVLTDAGYKNTADYSSSSWMSTRFTSQGRYKWIASWGLTNPPNGADAWQYNNTFNGISLDVDRSYSKAFI